MGVADKNLMKVGQVAPKFEGLIGVDGKKHGLADYSGARVLVVIFSCNHCPYVQAYEDRLIALQTEFKNKGIQFVAINSNDAEAYPEDSVAAMQKRAREKGFNFDYLRDEDQSVAKSYGATHTPHLFVFDADRRLCYTGRIDDNWQDASQVKEPYLHRVLQAMAAGNASPIHETFAIGCTIKWKSRHGETAG